VWEPHFEPVLFDTLAEDCFDQVGKMTTLEDFAREVAGDERFQDARIRALIAAGRRESAVAAVDDVERSKSEVTHWRDWVRAQRAFLERDTSSILAEFHAKEAATVAELKLGKIWEPSPFPAELPERERQAKGTEPLFLTTPWISRPANLWREVPENPGEVGYAHYALHRKGRLILSLPLTPQEAEARHRNRERYTLVARLAGGRLLLLAHSTGWSPHNPVQPANPDYVPRRSFRLEVPQSWGHVRVEFGEDFDDTDVLKMRSIDIQRLHMIWYAFISHAERSKFLHDNRGAAMIYTRTPMSDSDLSLCRFAMPAFGAFDDLLQRVRSYVKNEGFGALG